MSDQDASATKQTRILKKVRYSEDLISDDNSLNLDERLRRQPNHTTNLLNKLSEESITQDKLEYFDLFRKKQLKTIEEISDNIQTPTKNKQLQNKDISQVNLSRPKVQLSIETLELINKAKEKKIIDQEDVKKNNEVSKIMSKPSLRDRFESVAQILTIKDLLFKQKFKMIVYHFEIIDQMVIFMKQRKMTTFWNQISFYILESKKINLSITSLQQIIQVWPEAYQLSWMINEKIIRLDRWDLIINIRDSQGLEQRLDEFKNRLLQYVQQNGEYIEEAPLPLRLDAPKNIETDTTQQINQKPEILKSVQEILKQQNQRSQITQDSSLSQINISKYKDVVTPLEKSNLSQKLLEKVRAKEKQIKEEKEQMKIQSQSKEELINIASLLQIYYTGRQVSNMFLANVITYIRERNRKTIYEDSKLLDIIENLTRVNDRWLKIVDNYQGQILRMDKSVSLPFVIKDIENYKF